MAPKVYHTHIPKTAGTSLNSWLEDSVEFSRAKPDQIDGELVRWLRAQGIPGHRSLKTVSESCWDLYDVIHGHRNLLPGRTPGSIVLTVLRDPVARSISLFFDLASLSEADFKNLEGFTLEYRRDCLRMPFSELRKKWSQSNLFLGQHMDYMCRFFLRNDLPNNTFYQMSPKQRFESALAAVERDVTAFGFTEEMEKSILHFSEILKLYPIKELPRYNLGRPARSEITADDRRYLESITSGDRMLWEHLRKKFATVPVSYTVDSFESAHLADAMRRVHLKKRNQSFIYDMNAAFVGDGFWGRDSGGTPDCRRWSGPSENSIIYIPSVANDPVKVDVKIAGWSDRRARNSLKIKAWGLDTDYEFTTEAGYADVVRFRTKPRDGVLKLEFFSAAREASGRPADSRKRGFSLANITQNYIL